jgi:phosphotransferase system  glucose/maltose/N-acetylglucosamine-specific IIC component
MGNRARAWICVVLIPVAFVVAMFVGEGLISALGYESGAEAPVPFLVALLVGVPVTLGAMVPAALAVLFGRRARREGHGSALLAVAIGWATLTFWVTTLVLAVVQRGID